MTANHAHTPIGVHQEVLQAYIAQGGTIERFYEWFDATQARAERRGRSEERENMAANHERTPKTQDEICEDFSNRQAGAINRAVARENFDRMIAAAEQRGAVKALRDAAESVELIDHMYANLLANQPIAVRETSKYLHNRADQMEGDDD